MQRPRKLPVLFAILLLALTLAGPTGVGAQGLQPEDFDGLRHGVVRAYSLDYRLLMDAVATPGSEMVMPTGIFVLGATILEFDSADHADSALTKLDQATNAGSESPLGDGEVSKIDLDLGDRNISYFGTEVRDGQEAETVISLIQAGSYVYFVVVAGSGIDVQQSTIEFSSNLLENDGSGEGEFHEDGTSTGGLWDKFPAADDDLVADLIPSDTVLYPEMEATPAR